MSEPRLCWHCKNPIAPHRGRPSDFCKPAHKLAYKESLKLTKPNRYVKDNLAAARRVPVVKAPKDICSECKAPFVVPKVQGPRPKTCSDKCRKARLARTARERYLAKHPEGVRTVSPKAAVAASRPPTADHDHPTLANLAVIARLEARLLALETLYAAAGPRPRHFEASGESTTFGPVTKRHVPPTEVRQ